MLKIENERGVITLEPFDELGGLSIEVSDVFEEGFHNVYLEPQPVREIVEFLQEQLTLTKEFQKQIIYAYMMGRQEDLAGPYFTPEDYKKIIDGLAGGEVPKYVIDFLTLKINKNESNNK